MRNSLQVSWFNNAYSHEYALVLYTRVVSLVSRFPNTYSREYALFSLLFTLFTSRRGRCCCLVSPTTTRPPMYEQFQENLPGFDTVHELIYEKLPKVDLKGMKQALGRKGKGSATRSSKTSKKVLNF